jgi:hypothetical protein
MRRASGSSRWDREAKCRRAGDELRRPSITGRLHSGVSDGGCYDNNGAYTITVSQLVPGF